MVHINKGFQIQRRALVDDLLGQGVIRSEGVARALLKVPREEFAWPGSKHSAYIDSPLPLGDSGQTISAPHMVAIMLEEMCLHPKMEVLEIGTGSGYNAALMAEIVRFENTQNKGHITTIERVPALVEFSKKNLERTGYSDIVTVIEGDGTLGYPEKSEKETYDRIVVTAGAPHLPRYLKMQLKVGGILLIPEGDLWVQELVKAVKKEGGNFTEERICSCIFVPLVGADGYS